MTPVTRARLAADQDWRGAPQYMLNSRSGECRSAVARGQAAVGRGVNERERVGEVIFVFQWISSAAKVSAVGAKDYLEASIAVPPIGAEKEMAETPRRQVRSCSVRTTRGG